MDVQRLQKALATGDWAAADAVLAPVTAADDAHASLLYNHGKVLMEMGRIAAAADLLHRTVQVASSHQAAWFELGRVALMQEDFTTAFSGFSRALDLNPDDEDARRNLGRVALRLGQYRVARVTWRPLRGDAEADLALYRIAAESGDPSAAQQRRDLLARHPNRAAVIRTLVRVSKGAIPLTL